MIKLNELRFFVFSSFLFVISAQLVFAAVPATDVDVSDVVRLRNLAKDSYDVAISLVDAHTRVPEIPTRTICGTEYIAFPFFGEVLAGHKSCLGTVYLDKTLDPVRGLSDNSLFVAFRGTMFKDEHVWLSDILADLNFFPIPANPHSLRGLIHRGFSAAANSVYGNFLDAMKRACNHLTSMGHSLSETEVTFTGHSLGAALSTIIGAQFFNHPLADAAFSQIYKPREMNYFKIIKFSSPNIGDASFRDHVMEIFSPHNVLHFSCGYDMISRIPPDSLGFAPIGITIKTLAIERVVGRGIKSVLGSIKRMSAVATAYAVNPVAGYAAAASLATYWALSAHEVPPVETLVRAFKYFKEHKALSFDMACSPSILDVTRGPVSYLKSWIF